MANEFVIKNGLIIGGGGLQMSGSLGITGSLSVSSVTNAGTDTDKFLVLDTNGNVDFRTGAEVLSDIGGAGIVDTAGTPANNQIAIFTDSNTIEGSSNVTFDNSTFEISGSSLVVNGPYLPTPAVDFQMQGISLFKIDGIAGAQFDGGLISNAVIGVYPTAGSGLQINTATYGGQNVDSFIVLAASSSGATGTGSFWSYGIKASDNSHDFVFVNASGLSGAGVPSPSFTISKANNQVKIGSLVVSGSGTFTNIGPAQFSGSVSITTTDQVAASVDTDKFLVLDGQQIKYRTGAQVLSDIGAAASSIKNYVNINNIADFKAVTTGYAPLTGITDIQVGDTSPFANWIAPADGQIERIVVMVGETNTVTDTLSIQPYKNGSTLGSAVNQTQGAARTVTEYTFGSSYSFQKRDRITLYMNKNTNTSDLYTFNIYFYVV